MDPHQDIVRDEMEINLASLFWAVLAKWRCILFFALVFALLLGGYKGLRSFRLLTDSAYQQSMQESNAQKILVYNEEKERLTSEGEMLQTQISRLEDYTTASEVYAIDPYCVSVEKAVYYVRGAEESLSGDTAQDPGHSTSLVGVYSAAFGQFDAGAVLNGANDPPFPLEFGSLGMPVSDSSTKQSNALLWDSPIPRMVNVNADADSGLLEITVIGADKAQAGAIMDAVEAEIASVKATLDQARLLHSLSLVSRKASQIVSSDLIRFHSNLEQHLADLTKDLDKNKQELDALAKPALSGVSRSGAVKSTVIYAAIGFILGSLLSLVVLVFLQILREQIMDVNDLERRYKIPVIGTFADAARTSRLDRYIARKRGMPACGEDASLALTCANLKALCAPDVRVLLAGTVGKERAEALGKRLSSGLSEITLLPVGNICDDPDSVAALDGCNAVVFVEGIDRSSHAGIEREIRRAQLANKTPLGFVLVEDAKR